jgi:hypothetical protein
MRRRTQVIIAAAAVAVGAVTAAGVAGCSNQFQDQNGIAQANPDYILTYLNVDGFPNPTIMCIRGVGFVTTSRDYQSLQEVPEWGAFCKTQMPVVPHIIPGTGTVHPTSGSTATANAQG